MKPSKNIATGCNGKHHECQSPCCRDVFKDYKGDVEIQNSEVLLVPWARRLTDIDLYLSEALEDWEELEGIGMLWVSEDLLRPRFLGICFDGFWMILVCDRGTRIIVGSRDPHHYVEGSWPQPQEATWGSWSLGKSWSRFH